MLFQNNLLRSKEFCFDSFLKFPSVTIVCYALGKLNAYVSRDYEQVESSSRFASAWRYFVTCSHSRNLRIDTEHVYKHFSCSNVLISLRETR